MGVFFRLLFPLFAMVVYYTCRLPHIHTTTLMRNSLFRYFSRPFDTARYGSMWYSISLT